MKRSIKTYLKTAAKDYNSRSVNPPVVRASTILFKTILGALVDIWVVPPKPVTLQNKSYKGTAAYDRPNIKTKIEIKTIGVSFLLFRVIKVLCYKFQYYKKWSGIE